jgi:hypothetical protein
MKGSRLRGLVAVVCFFSATSAAAQEAASTSVVPRLVRFSGTVTDISGKPASGPVTIVFSLYQEQEGGTPLWTETQQATADSEGHYTVLLGSTQPDGLPLDLFTTGQARWLGVQPAVEGVGEQPRTLLVGVPYAMKAADADTLGGLPASAFVTTQGVAPSAVGTQAVLQSLSVVAGAGSAAQKAASPLAITGSGTTDFLPIWTSATSLGNSTISEVSGAVNVKGTLQLPAVGTATAATGFDSEPADFIGSSFSSTLSAAVNQHFRIQAEPVSNHTSTPSGKLSLLYASGTGTPAETGLSIAKTGLITFASGQKFPGTGTVTRVGSGAGLTGGPVTASGTLSIATGGVTNVMLVSSSLTVKAGSGLSGGGVVSLGGSTTLSLNPAVSGTQGRFSGSISPVVSGTNTANSAVGQLGTVVNGTAATGVYGNGSAYGVYGSSSGYGVAGVGSTYGVVGNSSATGVYGSTSDGSYGELGTVVSGNAYGVYGSSGNVGVYGSGTYGLYSAGNFAVESGFTKSGMAVLPDDRAVLLYSVESPENWYEDFGSGQLRDGVTTVELEPTFAQTVNPEIGYHVFVTPNDECEGLYATQKTATSFEVRELHKGKSNVTFDYRIVAKQKGLESLRLEGVSTDHGAAERMREQLAERPSHTPKLPLRKPPEAPTQPPKLPRLPASQGR